MLQRPYLSTDEYPPMTALPGMNPQVAFPSTGSRNLDALETGLGLDRQYDHGDMLLRVMKATHLTMNVMRLGLLLLPFVFVRKKSLEF